MRIQHNIPGMNNLNIGKGLDSKMTKTLRRLSSGTRIAMAADDAAGLSVSEKLRCLISEQTQCIQNVDDGVGVVQTADAALSEVNDMLRRAEQMCVQAQNDTLSAEERGHITKEINALYDEMERIFQTSRFSDLKLFQADGFNPIGDDSVIREYTETVTGVAPGDPLKAWGSLDVVQDKKLDLAEDATPATVTMTLDSSVSVGDASTLNGKSFVLQPVNSGTPVRVTFSSSPTASDGYAGTTVTADGRSYYEFTVSTQSCATVQDALDRLSDLSNSHYIFVDRGLQLDKDATKVNEGTREVTIAYAPGVLEQTINGSTYQTQGANGEADNGQIISSDEVAELGMLDGTSSDDNVTAYTKEAKATFPLLPGLSGALDDDARAQITANTITLSHGLTIGFTTSGEDGKIDISGKTAEEIRDAIIGKLNAYTDSEGNRVYSAEFDSEGNLVLKRLNCPENTYAYEYIYETTGKTSVPAPAFSATVSTVPATAEKGEQCTITLPDGLTRDDLPLSIKIGSYTYSFYKHVDGVEVTGDSDVISWGLGEGSSVYDAVASAVGSCYYPDVTTSVSGSTITVSGKFAAKDLNISVSPNAGTILVGGKSLLQDWGHYLDQTATIPLDLSQAMSSAGAASELAGKGFSLFINDYASTFEFVSGGAEKKDPNSIPIDVSGCTTYEEIAQAMETALQQRNSQMTVTHKGNGRMELSVPTCYNSYRLVDGKAGTDGLFLNSTGTVSKQAAGGTNDTQPQTTIDFSKYNARNFDELYGKGFRITCATCKGEFINIIFCHDTAATGFPSGKVEDVDEHGNPITYTNYAIELKDMQNGSDIVRAIVDQLQGQLDHFTDVAVGDPDTVLQVLDKRAGNIAQSGNILRAEILSDVYTNCEYEMTYVEHVNPDAYIGKPGSNTTAYYGYCPIFVGSNDENGQIILIHLPNLSLEKLNLDPPRPDFTDPTTIDDVFNRLKNAQDVIVTARGRLGADQNRLEHTRENLGVSVEQATFSYSTIKDADMAQEMTEQTKLSILKNFQQSTLAHIMQNASSVLELLY